MCPCFLITRVIWYLYRPILWEWNKHGIFNWNEQLLVTLYCDIDISHRNLNEIDITHGNLKDRECRIQVKCVHCILQYSGVYPWLCHIFVWLQLIAGVCLELKNKNENTMSISNVTYEIILLCSYIYLWQICILMWLILGIKPNFDGLVWNRCY